MISDALNSAATTLWNNVLYYLTLQFVDPFWWWALVLLMLFVAVGVVCWFFGTYFPVLRPIGGAILLIASFGLFAFRKGEQANQARQPKAKPKSKPPDNTEGWRW